MKESKHFIISHSLQTDKHHSDEYSDSDLNLLSDVDNGSDTVQDTVVEVQQRQQEDTTTVITQENI